MEKATMKQFVVIDYQRTDNYYASVHVLGCANIGKDKVDHLGKLSGVYSISGQAVAQKWADELNVDFGGGEDATWVAEDVKVNPCCRKA